MQFTVDCPNGGEAFAVLNELFPRLEPEVRRRLMDIRGAYYVNYGLEGMAERLHNKTLATILAEYQESDAPEEIKSGEIDGTRFKLFGPRKPKAASGESPEPPHVD